jgi:hypothetical protein
MQPFFCLGRFLVWQAEQVKSKKKTEKKKKKKKWVFFFLGKKKKKRAKNGFWNFTQKIRMKIPEKNVFHAPLVPCFEWLCWYHRFISPPAREASCSRGKCWTICKQAVLLQIICSKQSTHSSSLCSQLQHEQPRNIHPLSKPELYLQLLRRGR